jgi:Flp pilus assembly pilin Flp
VNQFSRFLRSPDAATAVEYAVMLGLIVLVALAAISVLGIQTADKWNEIKTSATAAGLGKS